MDAFVLPGRRPRWRAMLARPDRRRRFLWHLNHCADLDERYARLLVPHAVAGMDLLHCGAPPTCYVLSCDERIDGRTLPVADAIAGMMDGGWGTIRGCWRSTGTRGGGRPILLERPAGQPARRR